MRGNHKYSTIIIFGETMSTLPQMGQPGEASSRLSSGNQRLQSGSEVHRFHSERLSPSRHWSGRRKPSSGEAFYWCWALQWSGFQEVLWQPPSNQTVPFFGVTAGGKCLPTVLCASREQKVQHCEQASTLVLLGSSDWLQSIFQPLWHSRSLVKGKKY